MQLSIKPEYKTKFNSKIFSTILNFPHLTLPSQITQQVSIYRALNVLNSFSEFIVLSLSQKPLTYIKITVVYWTSLLSIHIMNKVHIAHIGTHKKVRTFILHQN